MQNTRDTMLIAIGAPEIGIVIKQPWVVQKPQPRTPVMNRAIAIGGATVVAALEASSLM
jgi:hypothetical protein